ncbi:MAG: hypothetical protein ACXVMS_01285 [Flavisolibacter sp.]
MSDARLTAYNVKTKEKGVPIQDAVVIEEEAELLQNRIDKLNIKYLDELIDDLTYRDMKRKLEAQKSELASKHIALEPEGASFNNYMKFSAHCSQNLSKVSKRADLKSKQEIIGSIFPEKLIFSEKTYRTIELTKQ